MNKATRLNVAVMGTIFGISGMNHGFFEMLQGNVSTPGMFIMAIGEAQKMWANGNEPAFTLFPNFLISGIAAIVVGLSVIVWSIIFVRKKRGPIILFLLFVLLFLVGGGVAQIVFFPFICLVATRINRPLTWWKTVLPVKLQKSLRKLWPWFLGISAILLVCVMIIATTGFVPFVTDPEKILGIMLLCLGLDVVALTVTFVAGFVYDANAAHRT